MPPVDLEYLVRGIGVCGDSKVACETTLIKPANLNQTHFDSDSDSDPDPHWDPDLPAESYCIKIGDEIDWDDINPVYDRDDSTKGTTNPKSNNGHHQPYTSSNPITSSKRFSGNLKATTKAPIIALPNKIHHHHSGYLSQSTRKPRARVFIPQSKGGARLAEPRSPEVSCFGKVFSQREQNQRRSPEVSCFGAIFRCFGPRRAEKAAAEEEGGCEKRNPASGRRIEEAVGEERPGLGGMRRFVSGRRPASWGGDVAVDLDVGRMDTWRGRDRWIGGDDK